MRYLIYVKLIFFIACLSSCEQEKERELEISYDNICIPIDGNQLTLYQIADIDTHKALTLFYGYNHLRQKFDIFDLTNKKFLRSIHFEVEGPEAISNIETFSLLDNHLFIKENFRLVSLKDSLITFKLKADSSYRLENGFDFDKHTIISSLFDGIDIDSEKNIFFPIMSYNNKFPFAFVNMENKEIGLFPFENPIKQPIELYGDKMYPSIEVVNSELFIINYNFSSKLFIYDRKRNQTTTVNIKSDFTNNETPPLSNEQLEDVSTRVRYHLNELNFYGIRYDRFRNTYLRVHQDKKETSQDNQTLYLSIISNEFKKLKEFKLPNHVKPYFEIGSEGIYFPIEPEDENNICFLLIKVE